MKRNFTEIQNAWITRIGLVNAAYQPKSRLICFAFAGGGPSTFSNWRNLIPPEVDLLAVFLPGREGRWKEALCSNFATAWQNIATATMQLNQLPTMYFGHSMGSLLAFEVARQLELHKNPAVPYALVLSGCAPPHIDKDDEDGPAWKLDDIQFIQKLRGLNGTPEEVLTSPELLDLFLPLLRADFQIADEGRSSIRGRTRISTTILGGTKDDITLEELKEWQRYVPAPLPIHMISGDHFFLNAERESVCSIIRSLIKTI